MKWYDFFRKEKTPDAKLYCGNPGCLNTGFVNDAASRGAHTIFRPDRGELYCNAACVMNAADQYGEDRFKVAKEMEFIHMSAAQRLFRKGLLSQRPVTA